MKRNIFVPVLLAVLSVNVLGLLLKLLELPPYIIIMGFRFHLSLVLPFFFIINRLSFEQFKREFTDPLYKKNSPYIISVIIVPLIIFLVLYFPDYISLSDPEYFYEFGLSSVLDLPVYLIWNSVQLLLIFLFLVYISDKIKYRFISLIVTIILLFAYRFIPLKGEAADLTGIAALVLTSVTASLLITRYRNIYWYILFTYLLLWIFILLFGSSDSELIQLIFASQYNEWEGFFEIKSVFDEYSYLIYVFVVTSVMFLLSSGNKREKIIS